MTDKARIAVVIPIYNESSVIGNVVQEVRRYGYNHIIVVDDGSKDATWEVISTLPVVAVRHELNRGKGAAAKTGISAACLLEADIIVTMDGDGQHDPADIERLVAPVHNGTVDIVLGTRTSGQMPLSRRFANSGANLITGLLYGVWVSDSQSGFRTFSRQAAEKVRVRADAYAYDSEVIQEIKRHQLSYQEVPISTRYTAYSMGKNHKQNFVNGVKTLYTLLWNMVS